MGTISGALEPGARAAPRRSSTPTAPSRASRSPFVEIRARGGDGPRPLGRRHDGRARGARPLDRLRRTTTRPRRTTAGRTTAGSRPATSSRSSRTAYVEIQDRSKDLVKSGGEWISTVALENALMGHPAVLEAAVIAVPDEKWSERPLAVVVFREGRRPTPDELRAFLAPHFAKWWLPGAVRGRRRDPEDRGRQVPQDRAEGAVRAAVVAASIASPVDRGGSVGNVRHHRARGRRRARHDRQPADERALGSARRRSSRPRSTGSTATTRRARSCSAVPASARSSPAPTSRSSRRCARQAATRAAPRAACTRSATGWTRPTRRSWRRSTGYCLGGGLELAMCCDVRDLRRRRAARPARDQARPDPRRRRHPAPAAPRRRRPREPAQPRAASSSTPRRHTPGASSSRSCPADELVSARAPRSPRASPRARRTPSR